MKFMPNEIALAIHMCPHAVSRIVLSQYWSCQLLEDPAFQNYFDAATDKAQDRAMLGYLWGREVHASFFLPTYEMRLKSHEGESVFVVAP